MNLIPNISIGKNEMTIGKLTLYKSYQHSASYLQAAAYDFIIKKSSPEFADDYLIVAVYLYRHAFELGLKALGKHVSKNVNGHGLATIFEALGVPIDEKLKQDMKYFGGRAWDKIGEVVKSITKANEYEKDLNKVLETYVKYFADSVGKAIEILKELDLDKREQLFRYEEETRGGRKLEQIKSIPQIDIEIIGSVIDHIYDMDLLFYEIEFNKVKL